MHIGVWGLPVHFGNITALKGPVHFGNIKGLKGVGSGVWGFSNKFS